MGVVSWGYYCANSDYPGVYSRISHAYKDFLEPTINSWSSTSSSGSSTNRFDVPSTCTDSGFYDNAGTKYNCKWYASNEKNCRKYGDDYPNGGVTANEMCCACGGGMMTNSSGGTDTDTDTDTDTNKDNNDTGGSGGGACLAKQDKIFCPDSGHSNGCCSGRCNVNRQKCK